MERGRPTGACTRRQPRPPPRAGSLPLGEARAMRGLDAPLDVKLTCFCLVSARHVAPEVGSCRGPVSSQWNGRCRLARGHHFLLVVLGWRQGAGGRRAEWATAPHFPAASLYACPSWGVRPPRPLDGMREPLGGRRGACCSRSGRPSSGLPRAAGVFLPSRRWCIGGLSGRCKPSSP